jgi:hypothetical protein
MYEFEFEIFEYSSNLYLSNVVSWLKASQYNRSIFSVGWLKLVDTKNCLPHLA